MTSVKSITPSGAFAVALLAYVFYTEPTNTALVLVVSSVLLWVYFKNSAAAVAAVVAYYVVQGTNNVMNSGRYRGAPTTGYPSDAAEAFQVKDPASIQKRLESVKGDAPLQPKVASPTGVLESASILDSAPLQAMDSLAREALPGSSIPARASARVLINPVEEGFVPKESKDKEPKENPYLQNGPDEDGVGTALVERGTDMPPVEVEPSNMPSVGTAETNAF